MEKHDSGSAHNMYGILFTIVAVVALIALALVVSSNSQADDTGQQVGVNNSAPTIGGLAVANISGGADQATLNPQENLQTPIFVHYTGTDNNGCGEIDDAVDHDSAIHQSNAGSAEGCSADTDNCYQPANPADITLSGCTPGGADVDIVVEWDDMLEYWTNPTVGGGPEDGTNWVAFVSVDDTFSGGATTQTNDFELSTQRAHSVTGSVNYGNLTLGADSTQQVITTTNTGNLAYDTEVSAPNFACDGPSSDIIPTGNVHIHTTSGFTYGTGDQAITTSPTGFDNSVPERDSGTGPVTDDIYSILRMPTVGVSGTCTNTMTLTAVADL